VKKDPIKICHIITGLSTGGAEMMLLKLLSGTDRSKFDSEVVSLTENGAVSEKIETLGIKVHSMNIKRGKISITGFFRLVRLLCRLQPDIIQGWMYHANLSTQLSSFFLPGKIPVLWNVTSTHTGRAAKKFLTALTIWFGARLSRFPVKVINCSRDSALRHESNLGYRSDKWVIIPNGFDTELFSPSDEARSRFRSSLSLPEKAFLIGHVGRYHPVKDHATLLRASALLLESHPDVRFVLVGEGVDSANVELMKRIDELQLTASVHLLGLRNDLPYVTAAFDIASLSSVEEAFPNVIGEAMACMVPCVVTDVGDSAYIVGDTGKVVSARDPQALAYAWRDMIVMGREKRLALGAAARHRVIENFSLDAVVKQYETLYEEVYQSFRKQ
jgi:glycosyltransferase involved in cell wall biosynthesis